MPGLSGLTKNLCQDFRKSNGKINPLTGRKLDSGSSRSNAIQEKCNGLLADDNATHIDSMKKNTTGKPCEAYAAGGFQRNPSTGRHLDFGGVKSKKLLSDCGFKIPEQSVVSRAVHDIENALKKDNIQHGGVVAVKDKYNNTVIYRIEDDETPPKAKKPKINKEHVHRLPIVVDKKEPITVIIDDDSDSDILAEAVAEVVVKEVAVAEAVAESDGISPVIDSKLELMEHQLKCLEFMATRESLVDVSVAGRTDETVTGGIVFAEMGAGKTLIMLSHIAYHYKNDLAPTLLVAPVSIIQTFRDQIERYFVKGTFRYLILHGKQNIEKATPAALRGYHLVMTTYSTITNAAKNTASVSQQLFSDRYATSSRRKMTDFRLADNKKFAKTEGVVGAASIFHTAWTRLFCDEAHHMASSGSKKNIGTSLIIAPHRWYMTGTIFRNTIEDLRSAYRFIGVTLETCPSMWRDFLRTKAIRYMYQVTREDLEASQSKLKNSLQLARPESISIEPIMTPTESIMYKNILAGAGYVGDDKSSAATALARIGSTRQFCIAASLPAVAAIYRNQPMFADDPMWTISSKIREIAGVLDVIPNDDKAIVFCTYAEALPLIEKELTRQGIRSITLTGEVSANAADEHKNKRKQVLDEFAKPSGPKALLMTLGLGEGLNIQCANHVLLVDPWWCPATEEQAIARAYRTGQTKQVYVYRFTARLSNGEETMEHRVNVVRERKIKLEKELKKAIREGGTLAPVLEMEEQILNAKKNDKDHVGDLEFVLGGGDDGSKKSAEERLSSSLSTNYSSKSHFQRQVEKRLDIAAKKAAKDEARAAKKAAKEERSKKAKKAKSDYAKMMKKRGRIISKGIRSKFKARRLKGI